MIRFDQVTYRYPERARPALNRVSLSVEAGEFLLLAGRSGSGKSTLLRTINGLVPHFHGGRFAGQVVVNRLDTRRAQPVRLSEEVGTVFQEPESRFIADSVLDEIAFNLEAAGLGAREIHRRISEIVDRLDLAPLLDRPLHKMSGGEQQRVAVAAALGRQPDILLLDEPTSQLDAGSAQAVVDWLTSLRQHFGLTTLVAEHRLVRFMNTIQRMLYLSEEGELVGDGPVNEVLASMPYKPPQWEAAVRLGLKDGNRGVDFEALRARLKAVRAPAPPPKSPRGAPVLEVRELRFQYNGIPALRGVDVALHAGEVLVVLGRNGSGKSTLLRCIMGLLEPSGGSVWISGLGDGPHRVSRVSQEVAYVPQWPSALLFAESVREELAFTLRNHGMQPTAPIPPDRLLDQLGLLPVADRYPRDLSAGERQRVALAAVMITDPRAVLLDEPTLGMDPEAQGRFGELLDQWREAGKAVLLATHDVEFAARYADRVAILEQGQVVEAGDPPQTLFSHPPLQTALQQLTGRAYPASPLDIKEEVGGHG